MYHPFDRRLPPKVYHFDRRQNWAKKPVRIGVSLDDENMMAKMPLTKPCLQV